MSLMYDSYHLISTPENVDLRLELAGVGNRVLACLIDTILTYLAIALLWTLMGAGAWAMARYAPSFQIDLSSRAMVTVNLIIVALAIMATFVIYFGYFIFFEGLWQGLTPGKKIVGIRVVGENGEPVSWQAVLLRNVLRIFDEGLFLIGLIFMVVQRDEKRMGDLASGAIVIRERKAIQLQPANTITTPSQDGFATVLSTTELEQADAELVSSFLRRRKYMLGKERADLATQLANYISGKLNPEPRQFIAGEAEPYLEQISKSNVVI
jgi:uncharacterized RDD family membrane protein YckC